jgi:hypothetical protein
MTMRGSGDWLLCDSYIPLSLWQRSRARASFSGSGPCRIMRIMLNGLAMLSVHAGFSDDRPGGTFQIFSHLYPAIAPVPTIRIINLFRSVLH